MYAIYNDQNNKYYAGLSDYSLVQWVVDSDYAEKYSTRLTAQLVAGSLDDKHYSVTVVNLKVGGLR